MLARRLGWLLPVLLMLAVSVAQAQQSVRWRHLSSASDDLPSPGPSDQQTGSLVCEIDRDGINDWMGYLVDSSSHYILGVRARAQAASTIVL